MQLQYGEEVKFKASGNAGPFLVAQPNTSAEVWTIGMTDTVLWDVANTDAAPVNCSHVDIYLSTDGGFNYPIVLAKSVPNTGQAEIVVPNIATNQARVKVKASNNVFFDISNQNFFIEESVPGVYLALTDPSPRQVCLPDNLDIELSSAAILDYDSLITLDIVSGLPPNATVSFGNNPFLPSTGTNTISFDFSNVAQGGEYEVVLAASTTGLDTMYRSILIEITETDFSTFALQAAC